MKKAVIDRIVDHNHAVLLVGEEEQELIVHVRDIPDEATEGSWLNILADGSFTMDEQATQSAEQSAKDKLELLRQRSSKSNFNS